MELEIKSKDIADGMSECRSTQLYGKFIIDVSSHSRFLYLLGSLKVAAWAVESRKH